MLPCKNSFYPKGAAALTKIRQAFLLWQPREAESSGPPRYEPLLLSQQEHAGEEEEEDGLLHMRHAISVWQDDNRRVILVNNLFPISD